MNKCCCRFYDRIQHKMWRWVFPWWLEGFFQTPPSLLFPSASNLCPVLIPLLRSSQPPHVPSCLYYSFPLHYADWQICNCSDTCERMPAILHRAICFHARACKVSLKNTALARLITPPCICTLTPIREARQWMKRQWVGRPALSLGAIMIIWKADVGYVSWILGN